MKKPLILSAILICSVLYSCRQVDEYQVYALKFKNWGRAAAGGSVTGALPTDSINVCNMFWLLKSSSGKNILVDAGFVNPALSSESYIQPDSVLLKLNILPSDISDILLTHPHYDHIDGIDLYPNARIWMEKEDYEYFTGAAWQPNGDSTGFNRKDVKKIMDVNSAGRLKLINGDDIEIMPGIKAFTGSTHTFKNFYLLVNSGSEKNKILLASDAIWFYINMDKHLPISVCRDTAAYVKAIRRMETLVTNRRLIIPGHDDDVFTRFKKIDKWIVEIEE